jgi:hypothetical protein
MDGRNPVIEKIDALKASIRETPADILRDRISICVKKGVSLLNAFKTHQGEKGWARDFKNELGDPMLNSKEQRIVEEAFSRAPWILRSLNKGELEVGEAESEAESEAEAEAESEAEAELDVEGEDPEEEEGVQTGGVLPLLAIAPALQAGFAGLRGASALSSLGKGASTLGKVGKGLGSIGKGITNKLPSIGSLTSKLPSIGSLTDKLPSIGSLTEKLPSVQGLTDKLPSLKGITDKLPSLGSLFGSSKKSGAEASSSESGDPKRDLISYGKPMTYGSEEGDLENSMDLAFQAFMKKSDQTDAFWGSFAYKMPGIASYINSDINFTVPIIEYEAKFNPGTIISFIIILLDAIRLGTAMIGLPSPIFSLIICIEEILTGQWRQALFTSLGFLTASGVIIGIILKYMLNAWLLIHPNIRTDMARDVFRGGKSLMKGFIAWGTKTFTDTPPDDDPEYLQRKQMEQTIEQDRKDFRERIKRSASEHKKAELRLRHQGYQGAMQSQDAEGQLESQQIDKQIELDQQAQTTEALYAQQRLERDQQEARLQSLAFEKRYEETAGRIADNLEQKEQEIQAVEAAVAGPEVAVAGPEAAPGAEVAAPGAEVAAPEVAAPGTEVAAAPGVEATPAVGTPEPTAPAPSVGPAAPAAPVPAAPAAPAPAPAAPSVAVQMEKGVQGPPEVDEDPTAGGGKITKKRKSRKSQKSQKQKSQNSQRQRRPSDVKTPKTP